MKGKYGEKLITEILSGYGNASVNYIRNNFYISVYEYMKIGLRSQKALYLDTVYRMVSIGLIERKDYYYLVSKIELIYKKRVKQIRKCYAKGKLYDKWEVKNNGD